MTLFAPGFPTITHSRTRALLLAAAVMLAACSADDGPFSSSEIATKGAFCSALSADGRRMVAGSVTEGGSLWNLDTNERLFNWNHRVGEPSSITACAFSPEGDFAITAENDTLVLWDAREGRAITFFKAPGAILSLALGPLGQHALLGLANNSAVLFDARQGGIKRVFAHEGRVHSVALDASGALALTGSEDHSARLWDTDSGKQLQRWDHSADVHLVALSADGARALSVSKYERAALWDTQTGLSAGVLPAIASRIARGDSYTAAAFSIDSRRLLTGTTDRRVQLWQLTGTELLGAWMLPRRDNWKRSGAYVLALGYSADTNVMISVSADGFAHLLGLPSPQQK